MNENVALINLFVKYYHMKNSNTKIYKDNYTLKMLNDKEYKNILKKHMYHYWTYLKKTYKKC